MTRYQLRLVDGTIVGTGFGRMMIVEGQPITCDETGAKYTVLEVHRLDAHEFKENPYDDAWHVLVVELAK